MTSGSLIGTDDGEDDPVGTIPTVPVEARSNTATTGRLEKRPFENWWRNSAYRAPRSSIGCNGPNSGSFPISSKRLSNPRYDVPVRVTRVATGASVSRSSVVSESNDIGIEASRGDTRTRHSTYPPREYPLPARTRPP